MNIDIGDYCCSVDGKLPIGTVEVDRLFVGGPRDGITVRMREGNDYAGNGKFTVVRTDKVVGFDDEAGCYMRERLSPNVIVYMWVEAKA